MASLTPFLFPQFFDDNGDPLNGGKIYAYSAGTVTPKDTYTSAAGTTANANPIILDSSGRKPIFLGEGSYDFAIYDSLDSLIDTMSNINGATGSGAASLQTVVSIAELKALSSGSSTFVDVAGYYIKGDGGGGRFYWDALSVIADDLGITISPASAPGTGRWKRIFTGPINVRWFGAKGDGSTVDQAAIAGAAAYVESMTLGGDLLFPACEVAFVLGSNTTFGPITRLVFEQGAVLGGAFTATISGPQIVAPLSKIFATALTVSPTGSTNTFYPQWWGATGDGVTDDTAALNKSITAVGLKGGTLFIPKPASSYLISDVLGVAIEDTTTPVHIIGQNSKIKRAVTLTNYDMFRYRSNMTIENIELEGYISSGTSDSNVIPANSYGFRVKHSGAGRCDNVVFRNVIAHDIPFDAFYADPSVGGHIRWINCKAYNCCRNNLAVTRAKYVEIDGGEWGADTITTNKNASIDMEPEPGFIIEKAVVKNIKCHHRVSFAGDASAIYSGYVDNIEFDGTLYAEKAGMNWGNVYDMQLGDLRYVNGARKQNGGAQGYGDGRVMVGRFHQQKKVSCPTENIITASQSTQAGWDTYFSSGSPTITEGYAIGGRKGIRLENSGGGYNYLTRNFTVATGRNYSFGCLMRADAIDTNDMGIYIRLNGHSVDYLSNGPTAVGEVQRICGTVYVSTSVTSIDIWIGARDGSVPYDMTFSDIYFCEGIVDNESAALSFENMNAWNGNHTFRNRVTLVSSAPELRMSDEDGGDEYKITNSGGTFAIQNHTDGRTELSIPGSGGIDIGQGLRVAGSNGITSTYKLNLGGVGLSNGLINTHESLYFNIDSDNDHTDAFYAWGHNAAITGHTRLMTLWETGNLRIGDTATDPSVRLLVEGGIRSNGATDGIGYSTGAGGTVTQGTDKSTGVTLDKAAGQITMHNAALAAGATVSFTLTNSAIAATDMLLLQAQASSSPGAYVLNAKAAAGSASIEVTNRSAGNLSEAFVISFAVIKGVIS